MAIFSSVMTARELFTGYRVRNAVLAILLVLVFLQPFLSARRFGPVTDEVPHIAAGYSYWKTEEVTLNSQHPPLVKLLATIPMLFMDIRFDPADMALGQWLFGRKFLFSNDVDRILAWARLIPMLLSVLLGYFIYRWARELFKNDWVGILALGIYAFMPPILAHAQFVTTDLAVAAFSFITLYFVWRRSLWAGLFLGLALATKFSALVLLPIVVIAMGVRWRKTLAILGIAFALLYVVYLLPSNLHFYLDGYRALYSDRSPDYLYYLNGHFSDDGFWYYFLEAFLIKTPIPFLIGLLGAVVYSSKFKFNWTTNVLLWGTPVLFLLATTLKAEQIGVRYLLPMYPFLIVLVSGWIFKISNFKLSFSILIFAFSIWYVVGTVRMYPDYLAYFNESVGGPRNGYRYLDDSNVEWGQDVKRLATYQREHAGTKVISPWEAIDLAYYGIGDNQFTASGEWWKDPHGRYAVSIFYLIRAKAAALRYGASEIDWLSRFQPVDRIGYSYFVYEL